MFVTLKSVYATTVMQSKQTTLTLLTSCVMAAGEDTAFAPLIPDLLLLLEGKGHFQVGALTHAHQGRIYSNLYIAQLS